jgi:hypothetical protein
LTAVAAKTPLLEELDLSCCSLSEVALEKVGHCCPWQIMACRLFMMPVSLPRITWSAPVFQCELIKDLRLPCGFLWRVFTCYFFIYFEDYFLVWTLTVFFYARYELALNWLGSQFSASVSGGGCFIIIFYWKYIKINIFYFNINIL